MNKLLISLLFIIVIIVVLIGVYLGIEISGEKVDGVNSEVKDGLEYQERNTIQDDSEDDSDIGSDDDGIISEPLRVCPKPDEVFNDELKANENGDVILSLINEEYTIIEDELTCDSDSDCAIVKSSCCSGCYGAPLNENFVTDTFEKINDICNSQTDWGCAAGGSSCDAYKFLTCVSKRCVYRDYDFTGQNKEYCDTLETIEKKDQCYFDVAIETHNLRVCDSLSDYIPTLSKEFCIDKVNILVGDPETCDKMSCFTEMGIMHRDASLCEGAFEFGIDNHVSVYWCISNIAFLDEDESVCEIIPGIEGLKPLLDQGNFGIDHCKEYVRGEYGTISNLEDRYDPYQC